MTTGIYFLISDNVVLYVGKTTKWPKRLQYHITQGIEFDQVKFLEYPESDLDKWESAYIKKYNPEYNHALKDKEMRRGNKLYSFKVGSIQWKKQVGKMRFRKLTKKSLVGFGKFEHTTVEKMLQINPYEIIRIYYTCSHITFFDEVLDELKIAKSWQIQKPGTDKEKFHMFCEIHHPDLVEKRKRAYAIRSRKNSKKVLKELSISNRSRLQNKNLNQKGGY